jgi:hypothetical protein
VPTELFLIVVVLQLIPESSGVETNKSQQPQMVKFFAALVIFALLGSSVIALPGFAPKVEASEAAVLAKGDQLSVRAAALNCSKETWPDLPTACLQSTGSGGQVQEARLVTTRR